MPIDERWQGERGDFQVFAPGKKPERPDPDKLWTDEQYAGLIEQESDEERRRIMEEVLAEKDYATLNEMIANTPDVEVNTTQDPAPPADEDE